MSELKTNTKIAIVFFSLFILGFILLNYFVPRMIIEIAPISIKPLKNKNRNLPKPSDYKLNAEQFYITTSDEFKLSGLIIRTDSVRQKGTIVLIHGIRAYKEHYLPICKLLADNGFNSVIYDLRAHGDSEGKYCTFGFKEKMDLSNVLDSLQKKEDLNNNYGVWGQSLGAAIALQSMAIDKRIKYGIIESTFSDFRIIVNDYARRITGYNFSLINDYLIWRAEQIGGFNSKEIIPSESVKNITQPILMVHGKLDRRIKIEYGRNNYENLASIDKEFIEIEGANHLTVWEVGGEEYFEKTFVFLNRVSKEE